MPNMLKAGGSTPTQGRREGERKGREWREDRSGMEGKGKWRERKGHTLKSDPHWTSTFSGQQRNRYKASTAVTMHLRSF